MSTTVSAERKIISAAEAGKMLHMGRANTIQLLHDGRIEGYQLVEGGKWHIYEDSVQSLLEDARKNRASPRRP